jgi:cytidylate kinase
MIVTIDGPAGSGKSTVGRKLAAMLEIAYLDTGAMYRAIALAAIKGGIDLDNQPALVNLTATAKIVMDCGPTFCRVSLDGHDVSEAIRTLDVSAATSRVARCSAIREHLVSQQRDLGKTLGSFVTDGRDQGSVVFPGAEAKFVLVASPERRAQRRLQELVADGQDVDLAIVMANLQQRDAIDSKQWEPLLSGGAHVIETSPLTIQQVLDQIMAILKDK